MRKVGKRNNLVEAEAGGCGILEEVRHIFDADSYLLCFDRLPHRFFELVPSYGDRHRSATFEAHIKRIRPLPKSLDDHVVP